MIIQPGPSYRTSQSNTTRRVPVLRFDQITTHVRGERCTICNGTGIRQPDPGPVPNLADNECPACDGFGRIFTTTGRTGASPVNEGASPEFVSHAQRNS